MYAATPGVAEDSGVDNVESMTQLPADLTTLISLTAVLVGNSVMQSGAPEAS